MQKFCGSSEFTIPFQLSLNNIDDYYGDQNLYCSWQISAFEANKFISVNFTNFIPSNIGSTIVMEILYENGQRQFQSINFRIFNWIISQSVSSIFFHYFTSKRLNSNPFIISVTYENESIINYMGLFISISTIIFICFLCTILFYKCSKKILQNTRIRTEADRSILNVSNNIIVRHDGQNEIEIDKNKEILEKLLEGDLKPVDYNDNANIYLTNCTICLDDFNIIQKVVILGCKHIFHYECLKNWLYKNILNLKCPNCNFNVLIKEENKIELENLNVNPNLQINNNLEEVHNAERIQNSNIPYIPININVNNIYNYPAIIALDLRNNSNPN